MNGFKKLEFIPCCLTVNKNSLKAPTKNLEITNVIIYHNELFKIDTNNKISLNKLKEGGPLILATHKINHQILILGKTKINPFTSIILRLPIHSYTILAIENKAEEHSPCATIKPIAPHHPQLVKDKTPITTNPICPTEEYAIIDFMSG